MGTVCEGAYQPFLEPLPTGAAALTKSRPTTANRPQVAGPPMPSILNGTR